MRTLPQAINELKGIDPDTAFSLRALRRMVATQEIAVFKVGAKKLINFDKLLEILSGANYNEVGCCTSSDKRRGAEWRTVHKGH